MCLQSLGVSWPVDEAYSRLTSRDPERFWTSGQWMTESRGGSDVASSTETFATGPMSDGTYRLHGYKWFASAADSDIALALARTFDKNQVPIEGTNGISMFYIKNQNNSENNDMGMMRIWIAVSTNKIKLFLT